MAEVKNIEFLYRVKKNMRSINLPVVEDTSYSYGDDHSKVTL